MILKDCSVHLIGKSAQNGPFRACLKKMLHRNVDEDLRKQIVAAGVSRL